MRRTILSAAVALAALASAPPTHAAVTPAEATALGRQAYLYGFPLLEFTRVRASNTSVRCPNRRGDAPVNSFSITRRFAAPAARTVVAPNVDTLYAIAQLDLGRGPVMLRHPAMGSRYFVFQLLDPYTNTIGYVGSRTTGAKAGRFAITWNGRRGKRVRGARVVRSPARRVWVIGRALARDGADLRNAHALMDRFTLTPPGGARRFARGCRPGAPRKATTPDGLAFLDALGRQLRRNPPPARDRPLLRKLATVGVGPGRRPAQAGLAPDVLAALIRGVTAAKAALPRAARQNILGQAAAGGGWAIPRGIIGNYGTDYTYRAGVALLGLGANTPPEAVYPSALLDAAGRPLDGRAGYRLVFAKGRLPPARAFWSLTMYDAGGYLVRNPQRVYAIGDSHPPLRRRADGSVVVVMQRSRPAEPGVNWLPTPAGPFRLNLRLYRPRASVLHGAWKPPPIVRATP